MAEDTLSEEEIVKALELCIGEDCHCKDCAFHKVCAADGNDTQLLINALDLIHRQKAEIERLTERLDYFQKSSDYHEGNQKELEIKNAELQKQVDELKAKQTAEIELSKIKLKLEKNWGKIQTKQAVKDKAKEICLKIIKDQPKPIQEKWVEWFKKEYGVEVE